MTLALDGFNSANVGSGTVSTTITTTGTNRIIVAVLKATSGTVGNTVSGGSLTWNSRFGGTWNTAAASTFEVFWALAPTALTGATITANGVGGGFTGPRLTVFGVSGANTTTPFDVNASFPATTNSAGTSVTTLVTPSFTTTNSNCLLFSTLVGVNGGNSLGTITEPSGFVNMGTTGAVMDICSKINTTAAGATSTYSWVTTGTGIIYADAIQDASAGPPAFTWQDLGSLSVPARQKLEVIGY